MADLGFPRCFASLAIMAAALAAPAAAAQLADWRSSEAVGTQRPGWNLSRNSGHIGFDLNRVEYRLPCSLKVLHCRHPDAAGPHSQHWSVELGLLDLGRATARPWNPARAHGVNLSLLGRAPVLGNQNVSVYGRLGTTYGFAESAASGGTGTAAATDNSVGLSYGAGLSLAFTPRLSATLGWDSHDFRFGGGLRDVRSTSLGLQYRY